VWVKSSNQRFNEGFEAATLTKGAMMCQPRGTNAAVASNVDEVIDEAITSKAGQQCESILRTKNTKPKKSTTDPNEG